MKFGNQRRATCGLVGGKVACWPSCFSPPAVVRRGTSPRRCRGPTRKRRSSKASSRSRRESSRSGPPPRSPRRASRSRAALAGGCISITTRERRCQLKGNCWSMPTTTRIANKNAACAAQPAGWMNPTANMPSRRNSFRRTTARPTWERRTAFGFPGERTMVRKPRCRWCRYSPPRQATL
jgi:hypothetical protein